MARVNKETKKDKTVGLCSVCEQYIANGHYKFMKVGNKTEPVVVCQWCEAKQ